MAVYTKDGQLTYVDDQGNEYQLFPKTKLANVEGLEDALKGKAPDGFGLGSAMSPVATNLNTTVKNGWFSYGDSTTGRPAYIPYGVVLVSTRSGEVIQKAFGTTDANYSHMINAQRRSPNGGSSWTDWEYENPPMMNGVEYRTTDRHEGKAIYKKLNSGIEWYRVEGSDTWKQQNELMGAAPAGYGLGGEAKQVSSWDDAIQTGFYMSPTGPLNGPWFYGFVIRKADNTIIQKVWTNDEKTSSFGCGFYSAERRKLGSTWGEWEWVNPPMISDKEYRTTERWNGKVVYTMLVNINSISTGTSTTPTDTNVDITVNGVTKVVEYQVFITWNHETVAGLVYTASPCADNGFASTWSYARSNTNVLRVGVKANANVSNKTAQFIVKYIKD